MAKQSNPIKSNHMRTDDLALSAYLRLKGYHLLQLEQARSKKYFIFKLTEKQANDEKVAFIQSDFLQYYNEIRNLKKLI